MVDMNLDQLNGSMMRYHSWLNAKVLATACLFCFASTVHADDLVEFLSGAELSGKVLAIRTAEKEFDFETTVASKTIRKTYRFSDIHAVTLNGKRHVLTEKPVQSESGRPVRTKEEVKSLIAGEGSTLPDWYDDTQLKLPNSLDLDWPEKPPTKGWNNQQNVGQYIWDIVNPNPNRWRVGIKMVHQILERHEKDIVLKTRDQKTLGRMYFHLLQDYPRAAYWLEMAKANGRTAEGVMLAECYWQLGNREMAIEMLTQPALPVAGIKLLAELDELDLALRLAELYAGTGQEPQAFLLAADALRNAGRNQEALEKYKAVIDSKLARNPEYDKRFSGRAQDSIDAIRLADKSDVSRVKDGRFRSSSVGYNGPVEVEVTVKDHRIVAVEVVRHSEKQFYSAIEDTPRQILASQSVADIDGFSGATITSAAIVNSTAKALASGAE